MIALAFNWNALAQVEANTLVEYGDGVACLAQVDRAQLKISILSSGPSCSELSTSLDLGLIDGISERDLKSLEPKSEVQAGGFLGFLQKTIQVGHYIMIGLGEVDGVKTKEVCVGKVLNLYNHYADILFLDQEINVEGLDKPFNCTQLNGDLYNADLLLR